MGLRIAITHTRVPVFSIVSETQVELRVPVHEYAPTTIQICKPI